MMSAKSRNERVVGTLLMVCCLFGCTPRNENAGDAVLSEELTAGVNLSAQDSATSISIKGIRSVRLEYKNGGELWANGFALGNLEEKKRVEKEISRRKMSLTTLGYKESTEGIPTGKVSLCGIFINPPFQVECSICDSGGIPGRSLVINGAVASTTCPSEEKCVTKAETRTNMRYENHQEDSICLGLFDARLKEAGKAVAKLPVDADESSVLRVVRQAIGDTSDLTCVKSISVTYTPEEDGIDSAVTIGFVHALPDGMDIRGNVVYDTSRTINNKLAQRALSDPEREAIEKCEREKDLVIKSLLSGGFVQAKGTQWSPRTSTNENLTQIRAILGSNHDVRLLKRLLMLYGAVCPECYLANR